MQDNDRRLHSDLREALRTRNGPLLLQILPYMYPAYTTTPAIWTSLAPAFEGRDWVQLLARRHMPPPGGLTKTISADWLVQSIGSVRYHLSRPAREFLAEERFGEEPLQFLTAALDAAILAHQEYRTYP